jgi:hypothetical protein
LRAKATSDGGAIGGKVALAETTVFAQGRLSASPKLGNEQTPIELLTPDADEAVSAKKRTR